MAAKETKTRKELEEIVMREAKASGKCNDLQSVMILGPLDRGHSNWDFGTASNHPTNMVSAECRIELNMIVGRLQVQYDLSGG
jgi:hypothetical protein